MRCCSDNCKKSSECGLHYSNSSGIHQIEDLSRFGSVSITDNGVKCDYLCGELGDYKMFEPIKMKL